MTSVFRFTILLTLVVFVVFAGAACSDVVLNIENNNPVNSSSNSETSVSASDESSSSAPNTDPVTITIPDSNVTLTMNWIPAGNFMMGSPTTEPGRSAVEGREDLHSVTLTRGFYMGIYPVTQEQYRAVMGSNPSEFTLSELPLSGDESDSLKRPVETVSWYDAIEFCNMLSSMMSLSPYYTINKTVGSDSNNTGTDTLKWRVTRNLSANGFRLPTEAEWEYACRAGTTTAFNCGTDTYTLVGDYDAIVDALGWYDDNSDGGTRQVGLKKENSWGLYDMHGNVREWCWDWLDDNYYADPAAWSDPAGPASGATRVTRGGHWSNGAESLRSARRFSFTPSYRDYYCGFRVVRSVP